MNVRNIECIIFDSVDVIEKNRMKYKSGKTLFTITGCCLLILLFIYVEYAIPLIVGCLSALVLARVCAILYKTYIEVGTDAYAILTSHKSNAVVNAYIKAVHESGRDFIVFSEYEAIIDYVNNVMPARAAKAALFGGSADSIDKQSVAQSEIEEAVVRCNQNSLSGY